MLVLLPDNNGLRISCTQAGPNNRFTQFMSTDIVPELFEREIAPARTFVYYEEVESLMEKNLIKGGSLENAVVVRGDTGDVHVVTGAGGAAVVTNDAWT